MGIRKLGAVSLAVVLACPLAAAPLRIEMGLLTHLPDAHIPLTSLAPRIEDDGQAGAEQGVRDNNTTGQFTAQTFTLRPLRLKNDQDAVAGFRELHRRGVRLFLINLPADRLLALAALPEAADSLLLNIGARDDSLRSKDCRGNLLHTATSRAMEADALAQFLAWKQWKNWFLVVGRQTDDRDFAQALERAAKRYGGKIGERKEWTFDAGAQRTDSGHVNEQQVVNAFTQVGDYDILVVADEGDSFGEYLNYRTYLPRPVAGTQALIATPWSGVFEQWGATQFQRRFHEKSGRWMTPLDYAAWLAVRSIGEAATRTGSADAAALQAHMLSPEFKLAAFKGVPVTYRDWNGQLRQPLLIVSHRILVSVSPQQGFLHQFSPLDTLGFDRPEVQCDMTRRGNSMNTEMSVHPVLRSTGDSNKQ
ncbi:MAG: ABC transporter substrate-binding protein [Thiohalocapsa sp.]